MRKSFKSAARTFFLSWVLGASLGQAAINVTFSTSVPQGLQQEFIANVTSQYLSKVVSNPYFKDTYSLTILGKNQAYQPPAVSSPILTATAVDQCQAYGFGAGLDSERWYNQQLIYQLQGQDFANGTCGFKPVSLSCADACWSVYNVIVSTIQERWGYLYDPKGVQLK